MAYNKKASILFAIILFLGCTSHEKKEESKYTEYISPNTSSMETFTMSYPEWQNTQMNEPSNVVFMVREDSLCHFALHAIGTLPEIYKEMLISYVLENKGSILSENNPFLIYNLPSSDGKYIVTPDFIGLSSTIINLDDNTSEKAKHAGSDSTLLLGPIATGMMGSGEKYFTADFLGNTMSVINPETGKITKQTYPAQYRLRRMSLVSCNGT